MIDDALLELGKEILKGLAAAGAVMGLGWGTVEWILPPTWPEPRKRIVALIFGQVLVCLAHWTDLISFGSGPQGWGKAYFFGLAGGALAPVFHDRIIARYVPVLKRTASPGS